MTTRRAVAVVLAVALLSVLAAPGANAGDKGRQESRRYWAPSTPRPTGLCWWPAGAGCVGFLLEPRDRYVSVEVVDGLGSTVAAVLYEDTGGAGINAPGITHDFCESTKKPIKLHRETFFISVRIRPEPCGGVVVPTQGIVSVTFSSRPAR